MGKNRRIRTSSNELTAYLQELSRRPELTVYMAPGSTHFHVKMGKQLVATLGASPANPHTTIIKTRKKIANAEAERKRNEHG